MIKNTVKMSCSILALHYENLSNIFSYNFHIMYLTSN